MTLSSRPVTFNRASALLVSSTSCSSPAKRSTSVVGGPNDIASIVTSLGAAAGTGESSAISGGKFSKLQLSASSSLASVGSSTMTSSPASTLALNTLALKTSAADNK